MDIQKKNNILLLIGVILMLVPTMADVFQDVPVYIYFPSIVLGLLLVFWHIRIIRALRKSGKIQIKATQIRKNYYISVAGMFVGMILGIVILVYMLADQPAHVLIIALAALFAFDIVSALFIIRQKNKHIKNSQE